MLFFADIPEPLFKLLAFVIFFGIAKVVQLISSAAKRAEEKRKQQEAAMSSHTARPAASPVAEFDVAEEEEYPEEAEKEIDLAEAVLREIGLEKEAYEVPAPPTAVIEDTPAYTVPVQEVAEPSVPAGLRNTVSDPSPRKVRPLLKTAAKKKISPAQLRRGIIVSEIIKRPRAYDI